MARKTKSKIVFKDTRYDFLKVIDGGMLKTPNAIDRALMFPETEREFHIKQWKTLVEITEDIANEINARIRDGDHYACLVNMYYMKNQLLRLFEAVFGRRFILDNEGKIM